MSEQPTTAAEAPLPLWTVRGDPLSGLVPRAVPAATAAEAIEAYRAALALSAGAPLTAVPHTPAPGE